MLYCICSYQKKVRQYTIPIQGRLQVSGKGGAGEGLVGDFGLVFPGVDPGFQDIRVY